MAMKRALLITALFMQMWILVACGSAGKSRDERLSALRNDREKPLAFVANAPEQPADFNYCAQDVRSQLRAAWNAPSSDIETTVSRWYFNWLSAYPPSLKSPRFFFDTFDPDFHNGMIDPVNHIQGFVRTNDDFIRYAGSHSNSRGYPGSIFFIQYNKDTRERGHELSLSAIHDTRLPLKGGVQESHPTGIQVIGNYVFTEVKNRFLVLYDVSQFPIVSYQQDFASVADEAESPFSGGGGLAMAKLVNGQYLVVASSPGGTDDDDGLRTVYFYSISGSIADPRAAKKFLGKFNSPLERIENMSLIAECGTGDLYAVQTGSAGHWIASKLHWRGSQAAPESITMEVVATKNDIDNYSRCAGRAAATTWVGPDHGIRFYCHEFDREYVKGGSPMDSFRFVTVTSSVW